MQGQHAGRSGGAKPQLSALTGVRFIAAFHVIAFHLYHELTLDQGAPPGVHGLLKAGHLGVSLFFVLSGFILGYNYLERVPRTPEQRRAFWGARFARVYPIYLLGLVVTAPFFLKWIAHDLQSGQTPWLNLTGLVLIPVLLQSWVPLSALGWNPPGWSLSVEAFFYACFPFLAARVAKLERRQVLQVAAGAVALSCLFPTLYTLTDPDGIGGPVDAFVTGPWLVALRFIPLQRLPEFLLGICVAKLLMSAKPGEAALPKGATGAIAAAIVALFFLHETMPFPLTPSLFSVLFALLVYGLASTPGLLANALGSRPLVKLGEASYALYILHMPVMRWLQFLRDKTGHDLPAPLQVPVFLALSVGVSLLAFTFVEEPARRWLRPRFERPTAPTPVIATQ